MLLADREGLFLRQSGVVIGTVRHVPDDERRLLVIVGGDGFPPDSGGGAHFSKPAR